MRGLDTMMPSADTVSFLLNLALAGSLVCIVGLLTTRLCRRCSTPVRHGVLVWTLMLVLASPGAVWLAQRNGLTLMHVAVSNAANLPDAFGTLMVDAGSSDETPLCGRISCEIQRGAGNEDSESLPERNQDFPKDSPHPNPLPKREGTHAEMLHANPPPKGEGVGETASSQKKLSVTSTGTVSKQERSSAAAWWQWAGGLAVLLWATGTIVNLLRLGWGYVALIRFCRRLDPLSGEIGKENSPLRLERPEGRLASEETVPFSALMQRTADAVGLRKMPPAYLSRLTGVPMSIGLWRPAIVMPEAMAWKSDEGQLQAVLLHEMAHIARRDHWVGVGQRIAAVLFWWNPLVHQTCGNISELREEICDNHVLRVQGEGQRFARILVDLAARVTQAPLLPSTVGVLEPKLAGLAGRVSRLLNKEHSMETQMNLMSKLLVFACSLVLLIGMATVGGLRLANSEAATGSSPAAIAQATSNQNHSQDGITALTKAVDLPVAISGVDEQIPVAPTSGTSAANEKPGAQPAEKVEKTKESQKQSVPSDLSAIRKELAKKYPALDQEKLTEAAIRGMLQALDDPNADYYSAKELARFEQYTGGTLVGIGVELGKNKDHPVVMNVFTDSPAESAGLRPGDELLQVDGQSVNANIDEVANRISGPAGSVVKLKVHTKDGKDVDLAISRRPIQIPQVCGLWREENRQWRHWLDPDQKLAYARIAGIDKNTPDKTKELIEELKRQGLKGLVLDLRDCPGGLLVKALELAGLFQKDGRLLTVKGKDRETVYDADGKNWLGDFPLVILINGATSSGGELIAGILQERGRAVLVGDRTFGKGTIQGIFPIENGEAIKATVAEMILPSGRKMHRVAGNPAWGVDPDDGFYVPLNAEGQQAVKAARGEFAGGKQSAPAKLTPELIEKKLADPQLAAALKTLSAKVSDGRFAKVGQPLSALTAQHERLRRKREQLMSELKQLDRELGERSK
jgi:carboxyl-terminal processing protease